MSSAGKGSSVQRALALLEALADARESVTATQLNAALGLPKATVHRLCATLETQGFFQKQLDGQGLIPGPRLRKLALGVLANEHLRARQRGILQRVSNDIGETCNISTPDGVEMVYLDRVETKWPLRLQLPAQSRVPLYCTASGKLYLASLDAQSRATLISGIRLERRAPNTITSPQALNAHLDDIAKLGIGTDNEEFVEGMVAVAAAVPEENARLWATISFHAPTARMSLTQALEFVPRLKQAAQELREAFLPDHMRRD